MNSVAIYDYLTLSRSRLLDTIRPLGPESYEREFPIGPGSLSRALTHIFISEWYYIERLERREVPPYARWAIRDENPPPFSELESIWRDQAGTTRAALGGVRDWDEAIEYRVTLDDGRPVIVAASAHGLFTQLCFHEVHHRAQALNMLRHLDVPAEELDYNTLMFPRRDAD